MNERLGFQWRTEFEVHVHNCGTKLLINTGTQASYLVVLCKTF
jgi:hypothetical protein